MVVARFFTGRSKIPKVAGLKVGPRVHLNCYFFEKYTYFLWDVEAKMNVWVRISSYQIKRMNKLNAKNYQHQNYTEIKLRNKTCGYPVSNINL